MDGAVTRFLDVPVDGGQLRVARWGVDDADALTVLALHGVTASCMCWPLVAARLPGVRFLAPDLRGRGGSCDLPGPYGMAQHARDAVAVLDAVGASQAAVVGHSMGGFVAVVLRHTHPDRVAALLLVDGGLPFPTSPDLRPDEATQALLGPALARLSMTFPDRAAYQQFWRDHPAFRADWNAAMSAYVDYDLVGAEPALRSRVRPDAVRADSLDFGSGSGILEAVAALRHGPVQLLRAPRGLLDEPPGLYPVELLERYAAELPELSWTTVPDMNHYTLLLSERGATAVAATIEALIARIVAG